jgi:putative FmdB family regulatory protein
MPIYDYSCTNCGHVVEVVHGVHETGPTVCPNCGGLLRKRFSPPAIHFRGTGWAKKDARAAVAKRTGKGGASDSGDKDAAGVGAGADSSTKSDGEGKSSSKSKGSAAASSSSSE